MRTERRSWASIGVLAVLGAVLLVAVGAVLYGAFVNDDGEPTTEFVQVFGTDGRLGGVLVRTAIVCVCAAAASTVLGSALALAATKTRAARSKIMRFVPLVPLMVPVMIGAIGWVFLLAPKTGWLNTGLRTVLGLSADTGPLDVFSPAGVVWVTTLYVCPFVFAIVVSALERTGPELFEAYVLNGDRRFVAAVRVLTGPLRPALFAGAVLALTESAVQFAVPLILHVDVLTTQIFQAATTYSGSIGLAAALSLPLLVFGLVLTALEMVLLRRQVFGTVSGRGVSARPWSMGRGAERTLLAVSSVYLAVAVVLPLAAILVVSLQPLWNPVIDWDKLSFANYAAALDSPALRSPLLNSLLLAIITAVVAVVVALTVSVLTRGRGRGPVAAVLRLLVNVPLGIPAIVLAVAGLVVYTNSPIPLYGTLASLVIAYVVHFLPFAFRNVDPLVRQIGTELEEAVSVSGGGALRRLRDVQLPMVLPGVVAGGFMVAMFALREFPIASMLSTPGLKLVAVQLVDSYQNGVYPELAVLSIALTLVNCVVVGLSLVAGSRVRTGGRATARTRATPVQSAAPIG